MTLDHSTRILSIVERAVTITPDELVYQAARHNITKQQVEELVSQLIAAGSLAIPADGRITLAAQAAA